MQRALCAMICVLFCLSFCACGVMPLKEIAPLFEDASPTEQIEKKIDASAFDEDVLDYSTPMPATAPSKNEFQEDAAPQAFASPQTLAPEEMLVLSELSITIESMDEITLTPEQNEFAFTVLEGMNIAADAPEKTVRFCITYSTDEMLSGLLEITQADGSMELITVNVNCENGQELKLSDFFVEDDNGWRNVLPDIVTDSAAKQGILLLCDVPPVDDSHPFYVHDGNIVLLYRPYEISTYAQVWPQFVLPQEPLAVYFSGAYGVGKTAPAITEAPLAELGELTPENTPEPTPELTDK